MIFNLVFLLVALISASTNAQEDPYNFTDISLSPTIFAAAALPVDADGNLLPRYIASVGNGHVSTTMYTDTVFMNGLYNGDRGNSHRARIPSRNNIRMSVTTTVTNHTFALHVDKGVFIESFETPNHIVEQRTFAHRFYNKVIVSQIRVTPKATGVPPLEVFTTLQTEIQSSDVAFAEEQDYTSSIDAIWTCGRVQEVEDANYQPVAPQACVIATVVKESTLFFAASTKTYFASYDFELATASQDFNAVGQFTTGGRDEELYDLHVAAWSRVWNDGRIEVEGNLELAKVVHGSFYYILSSLPVTTETNTPVRQFFGLSPGGLAYGELLKDYQGHSFWDTETWMYPPVLYFFPQAAQQIINYRLHVLKAARDHAVNTGYQGARFPWESGITGREVTPDCCPETRDFQIHITGDIAFSIRQYIATTRDIRWLQDVKSNYITNGCGMVRDIAEFWVSRATFDNQTRLHDINHVMPPDEDHHDVDNNGYTNVQAAYSIFFAKYAECLCAGEMTEIPEEWLEVAESLTLIYDEDLDYHPEYEGYPIGESIKQADVVLMGFPLLYPMEPSTRRNDLLIYEEVTRDNGPAMTWAMHAVGFMELDDLEKAEHLFNRSYQWYRREPYKVWTEAKPPTLGAINFITGMGGFLQSIVSGFAGLRLHPEKMVFTKPRLLPSTTGLKLFGLNYLDNVIDIEITSTEVKLNLAEASTNFPLVVEFEGDTYPFDGQLIFSTENGNIVFTISSTTATSCPLPIDKIGTPLTTSRRS